ncbi:dihydrofolate reductase [Bacteroidales bacterium AH-315-I05]|nr:dihydrofolate reductase [Bacteroidales bacterium AH-315-I05]
MKSAKYLFLISFVMILFSCSETKSPGEEAEKAAKKAETPKDDFAYQTEQFADIRMLRYKVPGFDELKKKHKRLLYYLYEAALAGRDIVWDQNYKHNLCIRRMLEAIVTSYSGSKNTDDYRNFMVYTKRVWFSNGIHHHYSNQKIIPEFSEEYFTELIKNSDKGKLPLQKNQSVNALIKKLTPIMFDPNIAPKKVNQDPDVDMVANSAVNYYEGVTQQEVEDYYKSMKNKEDKTPVSYGLNSKVIKENGKITEKIWKVGGMYSEAIEKIVYWLEKAVKVAENDDQKYALQKLVEYYKTGDLKTFDEYNIAWVRDINSKVDVVNGFIEVYDDPLGYKGAYESVVSIKDMEASKRIAAIGKQAQWFEDNCPIMDEHKKKEVKGISAKVITVVAESGDATPSTPIGINLPNSQWIRENHGSKSVNLGNIVYAYDKASSGTGILEEFCYSNEELHRAKEYNSYADLLHTDMHEVIGHASGKLNEGVGTPKETLKNYASTLEEARADLVALYYLMDQKLIDIKVMESLEVGKSGYDDYIRNGMMLQLKRLQPGEEIEEAHMRNRQLVCKWVYEKGMAEKVIEKKTKDGKTYFVINDYLELRDLFGQLLREIQRLKSEGDYKAGKKLVENYGVKVDPELHKEVLKRYEKLNIAPYSGFINPRLIAVTNEYDKITNVRIEYPFGFKDQMLHYAREHSFLPTYN